MRNVTVYSRTNSVVRRFITDDMEPDKLYQVVSENNAPTLEYVRKMRDYHDAVGHAREMRHTAEVPVIVVEQMLRDGSFHDKRAWKKWLNDPDNAAFRVWKGRV